MNRKNKKIYLAAPLFTEEERSLNTRLTNIFSRKYRVYLPQRDGILLVDSINDGKPITEVKKIIFQHDCEAIYDCDIILAVLNGRTIDEGVAFELGYAYAFQKECWAYKQDWRRLLKFGDNPMIEGAIHKYFTSVEEIEGFVNSY